MFDQSSMEDELRELVLMVHVEMTRRLVMREAACCVEGQTPEGWGYVRTATEGVWENSDRIGV